MAGRKSLSAQDNFHLLIGADLVVEEPLGDKPGEDVIAAHHFFNFNQRVEIQWNWMTMKLPWYIGFIL